MRPWLIAEQNYHEILKEKWEVVVLPFGATEPHNFHMPYGTDIYQVEALGQRACEKAYQAGAKVLLLPTIPYGVNTNHLKLSHSLVCSLTPTTLLAILTDLVDSMERQGAKKMLLLNGHGGNELKPLTRELHHRTSVFLCVCDWYRMAADLVQEIFDEPGEHADEVETSLGMAFFPELVDLSKADEGEAKPSRLEALNRGWITMSRPWHLATTSTGIGNPKAATAEKGQRLMSAMVDRLTHILVELASTEMNDSFPY